MPDIILVARVQIVKVAPTEQVHQPSFSVVRNACIAAAVGQIRLASPSPAIWERYVLGMVGAQTVALQLSDGGIYF